MAKYGVVSKETQELVDKISNETGLIQFIHIETMSVAKSKKVIEIKRCPPVGEYVAGKLDVVCVIVYEKVFERLSKEQQELLMTDAFNSINYDNDKIIIGCPQIVVSRDGRAKYGDVLINAAETAVLLIQDIADEEKQQKELEKMNKKSKKQ